MPITVTNDGEIYHYSQHSYRLEQCPPLPVDLTVFYALAGSCVLLATLLVIVWCKRRRGLHGRDRTRSMVQEENERTNMMMSRMAHTLYPTEEGYNKAIDEYLKGIGIRKPTQRDRDMHASDFLQAELDMERQLKEVTHAKKSHIPSLGLGKSSIFGSKKKVKEEDEGTPGTLVVHIVRAEGLLSADSNGKSDPFVKLRIAGFKEQTKVCKNTLAPAWDETFNFRGTLETFQEDSLELKIRDHDEGLAQGGDDDIGGVDVGLGSLTAAANVLMFNQHAITPPANQGTRRSLLRIGRTKSKNLQPGDVGHISFRVVFKPDVPPAGLTAAAPAAASSSDGKYAEPPPPSPRVAVERGPKRDLLFSVGSKKKVVAPLRASLARSLGAPPCIPSAPCALAYLFHRRRRSLAPLARPRPPHTHRTRHAPHPPTCTATPSHPVPPTLTHTHARSSTRAAHLAICTSTSCVPRTC